MRTEGKHKIEVRHIAEDRHRDAPIMKWEREVAARQAECTNKFHAPGDLLFLVLELHFMEMRVVMAVSPDCKSAVEKLQDLVARQVRLGATQVAVEVNVTKPSHVIDNMFVSKPQCFQLRIHTLASANAYLRGNTPRLVFASINDQADLVPPHELSIINGCTIEKKDSGDTLLAKQGHNYVVYLSHSIVER